VKPALAFLLLVLAAAAPAPNYADTALADPAREAEAKALMGSLRCLVCQGQSIADSDADMARDMRALVRTRMARGESAPSVRAWLIERYGDYITYDPPFSAVSAPLWLAPIVLLMAGVLVARATFRRRRRQR
jgi:cytochrome c-type biogenesis protein CcmH